ncbi:MAG: hydantoinase/oxoprolinase family protein [Gemmatimonadales bacterium]|nr:MAG: hydantoinase/oxoprolinase family protein [Gemmatimonadales bacterium]
MGPVLAVDAGGTFTDLLLLDGSGLRTLKVPSTPADPARAVLRGIQELLGPKEEEDAPFLLLHGSTVATNAILERKGARVLLVTNRGFEDVLEIGRQDRPHLYALTGRRPPPPVDREDRHGITGRLDALGREVSRLDPEELDALVRRLAGATAESDSRPVALALCLLHSYRNPAHEEAVARLVEDRLPHLPVSVSSRILPEFREWERTCTTVLNALVTPTMAGYLDRLEEQAGAGRLRIMGSAGGSLPVERARSQPVRTVLSGPAGGVTGALARGRALGHDRLLTLDMGGTSTDVALVPGELVRTREGRIGDLPVAVPLLDLHTVGAGGGSIAGLDAGGALQVGPASAGADPGPICYGRGGTEVTVTDAHVHLGRLPPKGFLGGTMELHPEAVQAPLQALADQMGTSPDRAALGILEVANGTMLRALRVISVERGIDPEELHLVAFGGAAGLHAVELARALGTRSVLVPPDPGLASAWGILVAPIVRDLSRTVLERSDADGGPPRLAAAAQELEEEGRARWPDHAPDPEARASLAVRYVGQSWELDVPLEGWVDAFHDLHRTRYGHARPHAPLEVVTVNVRLQAPGIPASRVPPSSPRTSDPTPGPSSRRVHTGHGTTLVPVVDRARISEPRRGPLLVMEYSSTLWIPAGARVTPLDDGTLQVTP